MSRINFQGIFVVLFLYKHRVINDVAEIKCLIRGVMQLRSCRPQVDVCFGYCNFPRAENNRIFI